MAKPFQSISPAVVFLMAALLFYSGPANSAGIRVHKTKRFVPTLDEITRNEWRAPEQLKEISDSQQTRMVDGDSTRKNQYPYMVALMRLRSTRPQVWNIAYCGGSLTSPTHILTSANCVTTLGEGRNVKPPLCNDAQLTKNIRRIKIHEKYDMFKAIAASRGQHDEADFYTRVTSFLPWIKKEMMT